MSTYDNLRRIIPQDQALANKALQAALQNVKGIVNADAISLSRSLNNLESTINLDQVSSLSVPLPQDVANFYSSTLAQGSGPNNTIRIVDVIGTPTGWVHNLALTNVISVINSLENSGALDELINPSTGVYTVMENCLAGDYTTQSIVDPGPPPEYDYTITIPGGLPGAGTYGPYANLEAAFQDAFGNGLNPAMISAVSNIVAANSSDVANANSQFDIMCDQIIQENNNLALSGVDFGNLIIDYKPYNLVTTLPQAALDTSQGGSAFFFESLANLSTQSGQAVVATMRESRNSQQLANTGIQISGYVGNVTAVPQANLGNSQYTAAEAVSQKIT